MVTKMNPFKLDKLVEPEDFCGRVKEVARLKTLIEGKANVIIYGDRRYGKTSLIKKVFNDLPKTVLPIYLDIYEIVDEMDFASLLYKAVEDATPTTLRKQTGKLMNVLSRIEGVSFSPAKSGESFTMKPTFHTQDFKQLLESAFKLIDQYCEQSKSTHAVIAFDEFQQVADIKNVRIDAMLRAISQSNPNVSFVFSGSKKSMLKSLLNAPKQPWHGMMTPISVEGIDVEILKGYCEQKLGGQFDEYAFTWLYEKFRGQTRLILQVCFDFYAEGLLNPTVEDVERSIGRLLDEHKADFTEKFLMFRGQQKKGLRAIASAVGGKVYSQENLDRHYVTKQRLNQAISSLQKSDEIQKLDEGTYQFTNVLFGLWLIKEQK
jgi:AAA+ ATPase superfamily predicted ATPase